MKKFFGVLYILLGILLMVGDIINGGISVSSAYSYYYIAGRITGLLVGVSMFVGTGISFFVLDANCKALIGIKTYKQRGVIGVWFAVFTAIFSFLYFSYCFSAPHLVGFVISFLLFAIVMFTFFNCCLPHFFSKSALKGTNAEDIFAAGSFSTICSGSSIYYNEKALLFKKQCVVIPIEKIKGIKKSNLLVEEEIVLELSNGKKVSIPSREYDALSAFLANR